MFTPPLGSSGNLVIQCFEKLTLPPDFDVLRGEEEKVVSQ
jgi:hypothetical protein